MPKAAKPKPKRKRVTANELLNVPVSDFFATPEFFLRTRDVARREKVSVAYVTNWCREDLIWPIKRVGARWLISPAYVVSPSVIGLAQRNVGRPPGAKNKRPYPKGVKRYRYKY